MLRVINGLMPRTAGEILIDGKSAEQMDHELVMGFVFQGASLLPWRTSLRNVLLGLEGRGQSPKEAENVARKYLELVGLSGFENHYPHELSGGMQQRVNLARALAVNPRILLMDEPFAALDAQTRNFMQLELLRIWRETKKTVIFVTHMIAEAILLSDRVVVFSHRPGTIRSEFQVPLPRPRKMEMRSDPRFLELENVVWKQIEEEVNAAGGFAKL
jgi:NitT/TauT family transport system ATP-binding protein